MEQHDNGNTSLFIVEPKISGCVIKKEVFSSAEEARERALNITLLIPGKTGPQRRGPEGRGEQRLPLLPGAGELAGAVVVIGASSDPLLPFDANFDLAVSLLKTLSKSNIAALYLQTRSPILVILLPLLQSFGKRLTVVMGLETTDDNFAKEYTPDLPLASERLKAADVLCKFGMRVILQTTQLPALPYPAQLFKKSALEMAAVAHRVKVVPFAHLFEGVHLNASSGMTSASELVGELIKACPEKLMLSCEALKQEAA